VNLGQSHVPERGILVVVTAASAESSAMLVNALMAEPRKAKSTR